MLWNRNELMAMNNNYDNVSIRVKRRNDGSLVVIVDYYKNGKIVDQKRTTNKKFIEKIVNTATSTIKTGNITHGDLVANYQKNGSIILEDYNSLEEYGIFDKLISKVAKRVEKEDKAKLKEEQKQEKAAAIALAKEKKEKSKIDKKEAKKVIDSNKELLSSVKNLKVSKQTKFFKKVALKTAKFVPIATLSLIVMTQVMSIVKNLPNFPLFNRGKEVTLDNSMQSNSHQVEADQLFSDINNNTVKIEQLLKSSSTQNQELPVQTNDFVTQDIILDNTNTDTETSDVSLNDDTQESLELSTNSNFDAALDTSEEQVDINNQKLEENLIDNNSNTNIEKTETSEQAVISNDQVEEILNTTPILEPTPDNSSISSELSAMETSTIPTLEESEIEETAPSTELGTELKDSSTEDNKPVVEMAIPDATPLDESSITSSDALTPEENTSNVTVEPEQVDEKSIAIDDTEVVSDALQKYNLTPEQFDTFCAVVRQEAGSNPEEIKNVVTTIINRMNSGEWGGASPWDVITAPGQFQAYGAGHYKKYLNHNYDEDVPYIAAAMLTGSMDTTHDWERFNSNGSTSYGGTILTPGGNRYK